MRKFLPFLLAAAVVACGGPPPPATIDSVYSGLNDRLPRVNPSVLSGRTIVIDPGHGGHFPGTVGQDSLQEASVNLGVSLYLWGLLREAGADVHLTRSMARDFLATDDSTLAGDLQVRVEMVDSLVPDAFVSIHHNAQPQRDPTFNRVETYYKAGDPASLDLAFAVHRYLMRNLGIDHGEVRQGNYYVLRNVDVPAILGESSYLTKPAVEAKLRTSDVQRLEAEAYFLGLLDYFARGIPKVTAEPMDSIVTTTPDVGFALSDDGGLGIDPDGIELRWNSQLVTASVSPGNEVWFQVPANAPNAEHEVTLQARNILGNTSTVARQRFTLNHPAASVVFDIPDTIGTDTPMTVRARILDGRGLPVADGTDVVVIAERSGRIDSLRTSDGFVETVTTIPGEYRREKLEIRSGGRTFIKQIVGSRSPRHQSVELIVRDADTGLPITSAVVGGGWSGRSAGNGHYIGARTHSDGSATLTVHAPGYQPELVVNPTGTLGIALARRFGGVLHGKRFVLDPEGGDIKTTGAGQMGLLGSHVNLLVARYLAGYLREAGAEVSLTRETEEVRTPQDVARLTNRYGASRYLEIRHRSTPADSGRAIDVLHFPGSSNGARMSQDLGTRIAARLNCRYPGPRSTVTYPLQQTAAPAIVVSFPSLAIADEEVALTTSRYLREQAYAVLLGILDHYGAPATDPLTFAMDIPPGQDAANWLIVIDDAFALLTGDDGTVAFEYLPATKTSTVTWSKAHERLHQRLPEGATRPIRLLPAVR